MSQFFGRKMLFLHYVSVTDATYYLLDLDAADQPPTRVFPPADLAASVSCGRFWIVDQEIKGIVFSS